jgi:AcrR family transcriptional regulator
VRGDEVLPRRGRTGGAPGTSGARARREKVLAAAEALIADGAFGEATVTEPAARAGVARATVFGRFGSKRGVLEALSVRRAGGPEMRALREAFAPEDRVRLSGPSSPPRASCASARATSCSRKAVAQLEPGAVELIREQREDQRSSLTALAERLPLREDLTRPVAVATLHAVTSVEAFVEMRTHGGTSLDATRTTLTRLAETVLR